MDAAYNFKKHAAVLILGKFGEGSGNNTTAKRIRLINSLLFILWNYSTSVAKHVAGCNNLSS